MNDTFLSAGSVVVDLLDRRAVAELGEGYQSLSHPKRAGFDSTILSREAEYRTAVDGLIRRYVAPRVNSLLEDYRVGFCTFAVKSASSAESEVQIHQDWSFVDEQRYTSVGLWCPLVDVDVGNGCLQVVRGSHAFPHPPRAACTPFAYPELVPYLQAEVLESLPMRAGQALLFDNRLFHCSHPNMSDRERVAATSVLVPRECKMRYYHLADPRQPWRLEVYEVEDSFFLTHTPCRRPENARPLEILEIRK